MDPRHPRAALCLKDKGLGMLLRLSKNAFVRQYGKYTYVLERVDGNNRIFLDAEVFFRWITRIPIEISTIRNNICAVYKDGNRRVILSDFDEFLEKLRDEHIIVFGNDESALQHNDRSFSYGDESPRTLNTGKAKSSEDVKVDSALDEYMRQYPVAFNLQIDITEACTERCIHCYMPEYQNVQLPLKVVKRVIDEHREQGGIQLSISGGECMLHNDFREIVSYARSKDLIVSILSNLTLRDKCMVDFLDSQDVTIQVSLYSMKASVHDYITRRIGSFGKTRHAIEMLHAANIPCFISCPTMRQNFTDYLDVLRFARSMKMDAQTDFIIMGKKNCDTSNLVCRLNLKQTRMIIEDVVYKSLPVDNEYFSANKKRKMLSDEEWCRSPVCGAGASLLCLDARGAYHPCPSLGGVVLGNCYDNSLSWVLKDSPETKRIRAIRGRDFAKCVSCSDRDYCSVCMSRNYNETGGLFSPARHFCDVARINHEVVDKFHLHRTATETHT